MKKMYIVNIPKKDDNILHIKANKGRVQFRTCKSGIYSFKEKASRKEETRLKNMLRSGNYDKD